MSSYNRSYANQLYLSAVNASYINGNYIGTKSNEYQREKDDTFKIDTTTSREPYERLTVLQEVLSQEA